MLSSYLDGVDAAVEATPASRNRVVDAWRALALLFVIIGHWASVSIWVQPDGHILVGNALEWFPDAAHVTWIFQVIPIFFVAGGYANAAALSVGDPDARMWTTIRFRRLFTPVVPVVIGWTLLVVALAPFIPSNMLHAGAVSATLPLWFIAAYLLIVMLAPLTFSWFRSSGGWSVVILGIAAISIDLLRFGVGIGWVGWVNYLFVWGTIHQIGYMWHRRENRGWDVPAWFGAALIAVGIGLLLVATASDFYPTSMVTIPGGENSNLTPPTFAIVLLGIAQVGLISMTMTVVRRWSRRRPAWKVVVAMTGAMMTMYLWHLTALTLFGSAGIYLGNGWLFSFEPGSTAWWLLRVPLIVGLAALTALLVNAFLPFEQQLRPVAARPNPLMWIAGMLLCIAGAGAAALVGLVELDATVIWWVAIVVLTGAALVGAWPSGESRRPKRH